METRKITIISTKSNKRTVINTDATTLGELKNALSAVGVDYEGMTFYEGLTKTELKLDESLLPHDVQRINPTTHEPETTNELAFMLTNTNKKIRSGAGVMSRSEVYEAIKKNGLQTECLRTFGKNFTKCKTTELISLLNCVSSEPATPSTPTEPTVFVDAQAREAIKKLVDFLYEQDTITCYSDVEEILDLLAPVPSQTNDSKLSSESPYSDDELDAMFKDMR